MLHATKDFPILQVDGFAPAVKKKNRNVLSVNAKKYKGKFAAVQTVFSGETDQYNVTINTMKEFDGESNYRIRIDGTLIGEYQNPRTDKSGDFTTAGTTFKNIKVKKGAIIQVEFNSHTNDHLPRA